MIPIIFALPAFLIGILFLYKSSDILVDGTSKTAVQLGVPCLIISVLFVGFGTSSPELAISVGAALQNENTLGILDGFSQEVIAVDSDKSSVSGGPFGSIVKNNTKTLLTTFELLNQSDSFLSGDMTFGYSDGVFYPVGYGNDVTVINNTLDQIFTDIMVDKIIIPNDIIQAENTPGYNIIPSLSLIFILAIFAI